MKRALIIGYGSIGQRHHRILTQMGISSYVVSARGCVDSDFYQTITDAFNAQNYDYVIVSNRTSEHFNTILELKESNYSGVILVEKPLFHKPAHTSLMSNNKIYVGYNLRFHPVLQELKRLLQDEVIVSVHVYSGQFLPSWRPSRDYRQSYSASSELAGGVLRDLSHELDYIQWLFGKWISIVGIAGRFSDLEITSEDVVMLIIATDYCPAISVQLNYCDRIGRREIIVNTNHQTIFADLIAGQVRSNKVNLAFPIERDYTYIRQHQAIIQKDYSDLCDYATGLEIVDMIQAIEESVDKCKWIYKKVGI